MNREKQVKLLFCTSFFVCVIKFSLFVNLNIGACMQIQAETQTQISRDIINTFYSTWHFPIFIFYFISQIIADKQTTREPWFIVCEILLHKLEEIRNKYFTERFLTQEYNYMVRKFGHFISVWEIDTDSKDVNLRLRLFFQSQFNSGG